MNNVFKSQSNYWPVWVENRIKFMHKLYPAEFFSGKTILELGAHHGDIGAYFMSLGAKVTGIEGREENVEKLRKFYPEYGEHVSAANLDSPDWTYGEYDIIINYGVLYHLEKHHKEYLINSSKHCKLMFLESVVIDSEEDTVFRRREVGNDQSLSDVGGTPSTPFIENILKEAEVNFTKYTDSDLNADPHSYDWVDKNTGSWDAYRRRMWVVKND